MIAAVLVLSVCITSPSVLPVPPGSAVVTDWFRRPGCSWCSGNRGLEFSLPSGTPVVAATRGRVAFAGPVGGIPYVVVRIPDGILSPAPGEGLYAVYGGLDDVAVAKGDDVGTGQLIGLSRPWLYVGFRLGPRRDDRHVDPAPLLGLTRGRSRLVVPRGSGTSLSERPFRWVKPTERSSSTTRQCSVLPPVVASAR